MCKWEFTMRHNQIIRINRTKLVISTTDFFLFDWCSRQSINWRLKLMRPFRTQKLQNVSFYRCHSLVFRTHALEKPPLHSKLMSIISPIEMFQVLTVCLPFKIPRAWKTMGDFLDNVSSPVFISVLLANLRTHSLIFSFILSRKTIVNHFQSFQNQNGSKWFYITVVTANCVEILLRKIALRTSINNRDYKHGSPAFAICGHSIKTKKTRRPKSKPNPKCLAHSEFNLFGISLLTWSLKHFPFKARLRPNFIVTM